MVDIIVLTYIYVVHVREWIDMYVGGCEWMSVKGAITYMIQEKECGSACRLIIDIGLRLTGEYPFRRIRPLDIILHGYDDPLLSFINSPLYKYLCDTFNNAIRNWAGSDHLPISWWQTMEARMINGTDTGSFASPHLTPATILPFFNSFLCRSFTAVFSKQSTYKGIKSVEFVVREEEFDTVSNKYIGFRMMRNTSCSNASINCLLKENLCHNCCQGRYVDGTYLLPPGMFPLVCFPGKNETLPLSAIISPPYFSYSPEEVIDSMIGLPRLSVKPSTFTFVREPDCN
ncbi:Protein R07B1.3 [Dirofilaria immitis]|nr:Protein R07B1.3 [Dirofilaria immitis]